MKENKRIMCSGLKHYEEIIKINLCRYFNKFYVIKNVFQPKRSNLWINRLTSSFIHFEANVKNNDTVDYKIKWTTYLAVLANKNLN